MADGGGVRAPTQVGGGARPLGGPDARLAPTARAQHGVVSRRQALAAGVGSSTIHRRLTAGLWVRLYNGTYRVGAVSAPLEWASAACIAVGSDAVISHMSAACVRGWVAGDVPRPVHLSVPRRRLRARVGLRLHAVVPLEPDELDPVAGLPVTAPGRTLIDLAAVCVARDLERIIAHVQRNDELSDAQLDHLLVRYRGRPGARRLRALVRQSGGPRFTRSEAEVRFLALIREAELPLPRTNLRVGRFELDAVWPRERVVVEIDGYAFHRSRVRFEVDRRKDAWLMAKGYRVIRLTWRQLTEHPIRTAVQVGRALEAAANTS